MNPVDVYLSLVNLSTIIPANTLIKKNVPMLMNKKKYIIHTSLLDYIGWKSIPVESMLPHNKLLYPSPTATVNNKINA